MAPWLCAHHRTRLHGTIITAQLSDMMWRDTYKVSSIERYPLAWDKRDIDTAVDSGTFMILAYRGNIMMGLTLHPPDTFQEQQCFISKHPQPPCC